MNQGFGKGVYWKGQTVNHWTLETEKLLSSSSSRQSTLNLHVPFWVIFTANLSLLVSSEQGCLGFLIFQAIAVFQQLCWRVRKQCRRKKNQVKEQKSSLKVNKDMTLTITF